ncbi:two-component system, NtrC family, C4-dicarboxylate transport response regulator DctD [Cognatiyoonia koreensis]|uniref:Two-component system, NtrC family, C4-dicarboxylate transport response regulator DctD n=1 Tax=Cognatiyoonia koreensis TaxID=364200 RepID=A0A1I0PQU0_9RHOB|nr:sigma-54 dependent transcriptional regulator [Cognatiyoonia koreensis]SEW16731.1 two-component system, NtrC family, C4-dicarboxylate transport response regulator DctD [Cognatiyoonia koreensis]
MTSSVLLVDDDREVREALGQTLELADLCPILAGSFVEAKDHINKSFAGVIVTDLRMPGRDGFHLLEHARTVDPELPVILLTGEADVPIAVRAMAEGAHAFLEKPCAPQDLIAAVEQALGQRGSVLEARRRKLQLESGDAAARMLYGVSDLAEELRSRVRAVAKTTAEVLVTGEAGVGTPKIAEVIHLLSPVSRHPFVKRASGALDVDAIRAALDEARAGSLFLDEVGTLPSATQFALLDALEAGGTARIIAATTTPLEKIVAEGRFSADLFYRLDLMRVRIPALRERPSDIPVLFERYLAQACEQAALPVPPVSPEMVASLMAQDWPGNARGLMSAAMRYALGVGEPFDAAELGLTEQLGQVEKSLLIAALQKNQGRAGETAAALKLPRKTFYDKLARHGIKAEDYRNTKLPVDPS